MSYRDKVRGSGGDNSRADKWWRWFVRFGFCIAAIVLVGSFVSIPLPDEEDNVWNFLALFSLATTIFGVALAAAIYQRQAEKSEADKNTHKEVLRTIQDLSSEAARSARFAHLNTSEIIWRLNEAQRKKTGSALSTARESAVVEAFQMATADVLPPILWVDDNRDYIQLERDALTAAGVVSIWVPNTSDALELLEGNSFGVVITDMGRAGGQREGYTLLDAMRNGGDSTPVLVYSGSDKPEHVEEVIKHGGQGATNDPGTLFQLAMKQLRRSSTAAKG